MRKAFKNAFEKPEIKFEDNLARVEKGRMNCRYLQPKWTLGPLWIISYPPCVYQVRVLKASLKAFLWSSWSGRYPVPCVAFRVKTSLVKPAQFLMIYSRLCSPCRWWSSSNIMKAENKWKMDDSFDKQKLEEDPNDSDLRKMSGLTRRKGLQVCFEFDFILKHLIHRFLADDNQDWRSTGQQLFKMGKSLKDVWDFTKNVLTLWNMWK